MRTLHRIGWMGLLLATATAAGCSKTFELTFTNVSMHTRDIVIRSPEGPEHIGMLNPGGAQLKHKLTIENDDLPATCTVQAGNLVKTFQLTKEMKNEQWFYIEEKEIVGPLDEHTKVTKSSKEDIKTTPIKNQPVLTPDRPIPPESKSTPDGGKIIERKEVVE
jgi:hypothetical protein